MATIADLHISISDMSNEEVFTLIRDVRSLRRELPLKPPKKVSKKKDKKQMTIEDHLKNIGNTKRDELIKNLMEIKKRR